MANKNNNNHKIGYKDIKLTAHAHQRAIERFGVNATDIIRKMAVSARYNGINVHAVNIDTYEKLGLDKDTYFMLKKKFHKRSNSERIYYHKGNIFIFRGNDCKTLVTVIDYTNIFNNYNKEGVY